ncbi:hypothetical protein BC941DRAFT_377276 [Chlamydoabsidia padenii]|nr:hypothetical protein BC941DRAFT_377276 [Chlamydoabsidia padenii]
MYFTQLVLLNIVLGTTIQAANPIMFCKCFCGSNSTIFELPMIEKPCGNCTKQFCLDNVENGICDGIADETCPSNDFKTACFARDSYKDEVIVRVFLIAVLCLVVFAVIMPIYNKWKKDRTLRQQYSPVADQDTSTST